MLRSQRRKLTKEWRKNSPFKYELYKLMIKLYRDKEECIKYSKTEAVEFVDIVDEDQAKLIIDKTLENER